MGSQPPSAPEAAPPPEVAAPQPNTIRGRVRVGADRAAKARVCAWSQPQGARDLRVGPSRAECTTTDAGGAYVLALAPATYQVVASARGAIPGGEFVALRAGESPRVDLELAAGGEAIEGRVVDAGGKPVAGASVSTRTLVGIREQIATQTTTAASGEFELWSRGDAELTIDAPGFIDGLVLRNAKGDYVLLPSSLISGTVVDAEGNPAPGVRVVEDIDSEVWAETDAQGHFEFDGLGPGFFSFVALGELGGAYVRGEAEYGKPVEDLEIKLEPLSSARAQVRVSDSEVPAPAGCEVVLTTEDGLGSYGAVYSDQRGIVQVTAPPGRYALAPRDCPEASGLLESAKITLPDPTPGDELVVVEFAGTSSTLVRVALADGKPAAKMPVELRDDEDRRTVRQGRTDDKGAVAFSRLLGGKYTVAVGGQKWEHWLQGDGSEMEVALPAEGTLEVLTSDARHGQFIDLQTNTIDTPTKQRWTMTQHATEANGRVTIPNARAAKHRVQLGSGLLDECEKPRCVEVVVSVGGHHRVTLDSIPTREVVVVDAKGVPIEGALVMTLPSYAEDTDPRIQLPGYAPWPTAATTDAEGRASVNVDLFDEKHCEYSTCMIVAIRPDGYATHAMEFDEAKPLRLVFSTGAERPTPPDADVDGDSR